MTAKDSWKKVGMALAENYSCTWGPHYRCKVPREGCAICRAKALRARDRRKGRKP